MRRLACALLALGLMLGTAAWADEGGDGNFRFERLADSLGGRQSTVYELIEDPFGLLWLAGDTDGVLRFDGHELQSWTDGLNDSLTRSNVSALRVASNGRLWVGTWGNGLQHWDREQARYVQFLPDPADPHALASTRVQRLMIDRSGRLWIGTTAGINFIDAGSPGPMVRFAHDQPEHPLHRERIWGMLEHEDGYWLATSAGVFHLSPELDRWRHFLLDENAAAEFERGAEVRTIALAHDRIWAGSQLGLFVFDAAASRFNQVEFLNSAERPQPRVNILLGSRTGGLWAGAHDGLYRVDETIPAVVPQGEAFNLIPDVDIRALYEDTDGNLWIGSRDQGIIRGQRRDQVFTTLSDAVTGPEAERLARLTTAVMHDAQNRLWLGVLGGVLRQNPDGHWRHWAFDADSGVRRIERLRQTPDGRVWIATDVGLFHLDEDEQLVGDNHLFGLLQIPAVPVNDMLVSDDGSLWLALWNFGVVHWNPATDEIRIGLEDLRETRGDMVYQLSRSANGEIWVGTRYSGLFRHDLNGWAPLPLQSNGLPYSPSLYCAYPETPRRLWLCTEDGLVLYDTVDGVIRRYGLEDGLPADRITSVWLDHRQGLWALTPQGVAWRRPGSERFVAYGLSDGLPGLGMQRNAVDAAGDGHIVLGSSHGAVRLNPEQTPRGLDAPRTVLSRFWLDGVELTRSIDLAAPALIIPANHRNISLQFAVLDLHEPSRNLIRHKLHGFDEQFSDLSNNRAVGYMNLRPGEYLLEVQGLSSRGVPGEQPLSIPIRVLAPWWYSFWVLAAGALLLGAAIWMSIRLRVRALRIANERLQALVTARTQELESANRRLKQSSSRDFLTGLLNRRGLTEQFRLLQQMAVRHQTALSLVLFDIDHFKLINDEHGHDTGDAALQATGALMLRTLRSQDLAARWGGEEFLLVLPETDRTAALAVCEKLREALANMHINVQGQTLRLTASFGVVTGHGSDLPLEQWVSQADSALYQGKRTGRNRIVPAPDDLV